jgi:hypothetical protein
MIKLERNAYSPSSLAEALDFIVSSKTIRRHIKAGKLKAKRLGRRNIYITRAWVEEWLDALPSAAEKTSHHDHKPGGGRRTRRVMTASELARLHVDQQRRREARKMKPEKP